MYDLIIFDCDGVLIDSEWLANQIDVEELASLGCSITLEEYLDIGLGSTTEDVEKQLLTNYGFKLCNDFWQRVQLRYEKEFLEKLTPIEGIKEAVQNLSIPCCVASSSDWQRLKFTLSVTGLFPSFEGRIFGRECVKKWKPEPDIFLYAAEQMGIEPSKCLVIEDSIHGIKAAQAAGMDVWAFCGGRHYNEKMKEKLEKSGALQIFDSMKRLFDHYSASRVGYRSSRSSQSLEI